jgi:hypothetical protein
VIAAKDLRLVSLLSIGSPDADCPASLFLEAYRQSNPLHDVVLVDGSTALSGMPHQDGASVVLLNADRGEVMDILASNKSVAAAIERYSLFTWWKYHRQGDRQRAFWIHGRKPAVDRLRGTGAAEIEISPLYDAGGLCAFGSEAMTLPLLLARYLAALQP